MGLGKPREYGGWKSGYQISSSAEASVGKVESVFCKTEINIIINININIDININININIDIKESQYH